MTSPKPLYSMLAILAVAALAAAPASAQPDLVISNVQILGCDKAQVTMTNQGNESANVITAAGFVAYPSGTPNQDRYQKNAFYSTLGPGASLTRQISGKAPIPFGGKERIFTSDIPHTIQVVADAEQKVNESNENNNVFNMTYTPQGCSLDAPADLSAKFTAPPYSSLPGTYPAKFSVSFKNEGGGSTPAKTVTLLRFSGSSVSGAGEAVASASLPALGPNQTKSLGFTDSNHPQTGTFTYALQYQGGLSDANNSNHVATKTVTFTMPTAPGSSSSGNPGGCNLMAVFGSPPGSSFTGGGSISWQVLFKNIGSATCNSFKVALMRYSVAPGRGGCGGYGTRIGGSGAFQNVNALSPNQTQVVTFVETKTPKSGTHCYKLSYSPAFNDINNNNHRPERTVQFTP